MVDLAQEYQINEISITALDGTVTDVRYLMEELNIYENIFSTTLSGNIVLNDSLNLPAKESILGHETLTVSLEFPTIGHTLELQFWIYKQSGTTLPNEGSQMYMLHFVSPEFREDRKQKISQSWSFQYPNEIIKDIFKTYFPATDTKKRPIETEQPLYKQNIVVPSWSPFKTIHWLTTRAVTDKHSTGQGNAANFLFYETQYGYVFQSIAKMLTGKVALHPFTGEELKYVYHPASYRINGESNSSEDFRAIKEFYFEDTFDAMKNLTLGLYANKLTTYDIVKKEILEFNFDLSEDWGKQKHLEPAKKPNGQGSSIPGSLTEGGYFQAYNQLEMLYPKHFNLFGDNDAINETPERYPEKWLQTRISQIQALSHIKLTIKVPGDLTRKVGEIVEVMLPSPETQKPSEMIYDKYRQGRYLITGIRHQFQKLDYNSHLQLQKDSLFESLPLEGSSR